MLREQSLQVSQLKEPTNLRVNLSTMEGSISAKYMSISSFSRSEVFIIGRSFSSSFLAVSLKRRKRSLILSCSMLSYFPDVEPVDVEPVDVEVVCVELSAKDNSTSSLFLVTFIRESFVDKSSEFSMRLEL